MTGFCVRICKHVQPYVMGLAAEHIEALRERCDELAQRMCLNRRRKLRVIAVTARVDRSMMKGRQFRCFDMFGFEFKLCEGAKQGRTQEFVLKFAMAPDFEPEDMPPRLRRKHGEPLSAQPKRTAPRRKTRNDESKAAKKRGAERIGAPLCWLWIETWLAQLATSSKAKLCEMYDLYHKLSAKAAAMWRRRPRVAFIRPRKQSLTTLFEARPDRLPRARLEPRVFSESIGLPLLLYTLVSREPAIDWDAWLFGERSAESERIRA
jgi:hypothetical protein